MNQTIKPCPICGGTECRPVIDDDSNVWCDCPKCEFSVLKTYWDRLSDASALLRAVEVLDSGIVTAYDSDASGSVLLDLGFILDVLQWGEYPVGSLADALLALAERIGSEE